MPSVPIAVSIADILEVRGGPLREGEVWALLCQSAAAIQDCFIKGASGNKDDTPFVISPTTLTVCRDGQVILSSGDSAWYGTDFMAPEFSGDTAHTLSDTAIEKMLLYTLGKTLQVATEYGLRRNEYVSVSHHLDSLLEAMCEENPAVRVGLRTILEACDLHTRQHPDKLPYAQTICLLFSSVLGSVDQTGLDTSYSSDHSRQSSVVLRSRRRPRHPHHLHHHDRHSTLSSRSPSPTHTRSRSRSRSRSRGATDTVKDSYPPVNALEDQNEKTDPGPSIATSSSSVTTGILTTVTTTSIPGGPASSQDLHMSFASSMDDQTSLYRSAPSYQAFPSMPGMLSLRMGSPAYEKYLQLKERQRRLKAAKTGEQVDAGERRSSAAHAMLPHHPGAVRGDMMDYLADARSMASLMSYTLGSYMPELASLDTLSTPAVAHDDADGGSLMSSDLSFLVQDGVTNRPSLPNQPTEPKPVDMPSRLKRRREDDIAEEQQKQPADSHRKPLQELANETKQTENKLASKLQSREMQAHDQPSQLFEQQAYEPQSNMPQSLLMEAQQQQQLQYLQQFGSRDLTPTPDALPAREYYGPEFVYRASRPVVRISLPLQGESVKNPALTRRIMIVHLTGQKFEAIVDPCMTGRQLYDAVVTHTALDDFFFFGLTYVCEGEHFFLDADTKLYKMAPEGWREGARGHMPPVTFTLYLRVKFYPDSLADFRHESSQHLLYLQLRRDVLEERCMVDDKHLLTLSGLALHAEFGDYSRRTMGHNYFVPEQYLPARVARRLGMGYVHDRALEAHKDALSLAPSQCEMQYIKLVQSLPEYGIHFYKLMKAKNDTNNMVWVGLTQTSMLIAEQSGSQRTVHRSLHWNAILKISFNKRRFSVQPKVDPAAHAKGKPPKISFYTNSYRKGRYLLQLSTAQHRFHIRMRTRAAALENVDAGEGLYESEGLQSLSFNPARHGAMMEEEKEGEEGEEEEEEEEAHQMQLPLTDVPTLPVTVSRSEAVPLASPAKMSLSTETDSKSSMEGEDNPDLPPLKYRSPPPYRANLDRFLENLAPGSQPVNAQARLPKLEAEMGLHDSLNGGPLHGLQLSKIQNGASGLVTDSISSPQLSELQDKDASPLHGPSHPSDHHLSPVTHLTSGQPSLGRRVLEVTLQKEGDVGIGITIVGGETTSSLDLGIFVKSVMKDGPAARTGQVHAGDRLIAINGMSLEGVQHQEAVQLIRDSVGSVTLLLSQMQPPSTVRRKPKTTRTRADFNDVCHSDHEDLEVSHQGHLHPPDNIPSELSGATSSPSHHSHISPNHHSSHASHNTFDFVDNGSREPYRMTDAVSQGLEFSDSEHDSESVDIRDEVLLSEDMLAAAELDSQSYCSSELFRALDAQPDLDKETQELEILGDIANMTVDNSDTDSDFESAVQATVEGRITRSASGRTEREPKPLRKAFSVSSPDTVIYEVVLEKHHGSLGIITAGGEEGKNRLSIMSLVPGGPAEAGGILQPGDCLLELNNHSLKGATRSELDKALQTAPDLCLLKVARTKSLDQLAHDEQANKNSGLVQGPADGGNILPEELTGQETPISPPSAFASAAPTPVKDMPSIPIVPPPPPLSLDLLRVEDERSYNTQSDVDSDVLDSSRSELERIYVSAERYLENDLGEFDLDAAVVAAGLNLSVKEHGSGECGAREDSDNVGDLSPVTVKDKSPLSSGSADSSQQLAGKPRGKSLVRQHNVTEAGEKEEKESDSAQGDYDSNNDQVEEFTVELVKSPGGGLGFTVVGGVSTTGGCYVKAVVQDPALSDGRLRPGDRLIKVNGQDMTGSSHFEAVTFLRQTPAKVSIKVRRSSHTSRPFSSPPQQLGKSGPPSHVQNVVGASQGEERHIQKSRNAEPDENSSESVSDQQQRPQAAAEEKGEVQQQPAKDVARCLDTPKAIIRPYTHGQKVLQTQHGIGTQPARAESNTGVMRIVLDKSKHVDSLGFSLVQRRMDDDQSGIFIKTLTPGSIAHSDGQLRVGDRLLQVNGVSLIGCSHTKAVRLLREAEGSVVLTVTRASGEDLERSQFLSVPNRHLALSDSTYSSDDVTDVDINDMLDEAMNFLSDDNESDKTSQQGKVEPLTPTPSDKQEEITPRQSEHNLHSSPSKSETCSSSKPRSPNDDRPSEPPQLPLHEDVGFLNQPSQETNETNQEHEDVDDLSNWPSQKTNESDQALSGFVRKLSGLEIPDNLTVRSLSSLPILRMRQGLEERTLLLLQFLADAMEQEEPLLEFQKLRQMKATDNMETAKLVENKARNRYRNVLPYDYNRVKLQTSSPDDNDYINASLVDLSMHGEEEQLSFIACQGPLPATQDHFWQMVWERDVSLVAMLTQEVESGKVKCHRYWPHFVGESLDLCEGKLSVSLMKEQKGDDFDVHHMTLVNSHSGEERRIIHMHYTTWPDHGVPDTAYPLLQFLRLMHQHHCSGPLVIHCSAGIGRSGVLMAVDTALARIETGDELDLFDIVSEMRQQRYGMIQTQDQYLFCYTACMEALLTVER